MKTDDAMEVHFSLRLLDRVADHAYCQNYPDVNPAWEPWHLQCWSSHYSDTLKEASMKGRKLSCVVSAYPWGH